MNKHLSIVKIFIAAALLISCCFVMSCENTPEAIDEWTKNKQMVDSVTNVESYLSQEGKVKSKLTSVLMLMVKSDTAQYIEFPHRLHADFYDDSSRVESWLDSKYGKYFQTYEKVYLRDSVVVIGVKGDTLRCHDLWWDQNRGLFYTDSVATYHSPGNHITGGKGMEATQDFKTVTFKYPIGDMRIGQDGFAQ